MGGSLPPLPLAVSNNAVAVTNDGTTETIYSMMGLGSSRDWNSITNRSFALDVVSNRWRELPPVPGPGRIAATAQAVRGRVFLFGGYTVAEDGAEKSVPDVNELDLVNGRWVRRAPMPLPVDDAVSGVWRDSLVFIVSGWHDNDNVAAVQIYDTVLDRWLPATPIPGTPVFGHAGAISGNSIVFIDGVRKNTSRPRYTMQPQSWLGTINPDTPDSIVWEPLEPHPGPALYRAAAGACDRFILFAGGSANPYNYNGVGYDGDVSNPEHVMFAFDTENRTWHAMEPMPQATMDHRALAVLRERVAIIGGMVQGPRVTAGVITRQPLECLTPAAR